MTMTVERIAIHVGPARLNIAWVEFGNPSHPTLLMIMGLAAQLVNWPRGFIDALVARGLHVVAFDNRDAGRSSHMLHAPPPNLPAVLQGDSSSVSYTLSDMAADAVGLLDALGMDDVHVVGASMGGGIAQLVALEYPARVRSLTSMMWTTGAPDVGQVHPEVARVLFGDPFPKTRDEHIAATLRRHDVIGSAAFPMDRAAIAELAGITYDRDHDEVAIARQAVATVASGDRTAALRTLDVPTLVLHGLADKMCDPSGGRATAAAIPNAELVLLDGMGHHLPESLWEIIAAHIAAVVQKGERRVRGARPESPPDRLPE